MTKSSQPVGLRATKPFLCRLGQHQWELRSARYFTKNVKFCSRCDEPENTELGDALKFEVALYEHALSKGYSVGKTYDFMFKQFYGMG